MRHPFRKNPSPVLIAGVVLVALLAACRPKPPEEPPAPNPPAPEAAAPEATPPAAPVEAAGVSTDVAPAPAQPSADAPKSSGPELATMTLASAGSKLGVPVDLRYSFDGTVEAGRPVTLNLAAVPRVAGSNLSVSIKDVDGIQAVAAPITAQKASAGTAYRRQLSVTRLAGGPSELRVLVTMEMPEGSAHSWFSVPFQPSARAVKGATVEQQ